MEIDWPLTLKNFWTYGGGTLFGAAVTFLITKHGSRDKRAKMRSNLYQDLAISYARMHDLLDVTDDPSIGWKDTHMTFEQDYFFNALQRDMDTFRSIKEYATIKDLNDQLTAVKSYEHSGVVNAAELVQGSFAYFLADGMLDQKLFSIFLDNETRKELDSLVAERKADLKSILAGDF